MKNNTSLFRYKNILLLVAITAQGGTFASENEITFDPNVDDNRASFVLTPKMLGNDVSLSSSFGNIIGGGVIEDETLKSKSAIYTGSCSTDAPFEFLIGGKRGRGTIGAPSASLENISVELVDPNGRGKVEVSKDHTFQEFFAGLGSDDSGFAGVPFRYKMMDSVKGTMLKVTCADEDPVDIIVFVQDKMKQMVEATVTQDLGSGDQTVEIVGDLAVASKQNLRADHVAPVAGRNKGRKLLRSRSVVEGSASPTSIILSKNDEMGSASVSSSGADITLVQMLFEDGNGMLVPRTLPVSTGHKSDKKSRALKEGFSNTIQLVESSIDKNGDVTFKFERFGENEKDSSLLHARIGIAHECGDEVKHIVDMNSMLTGNEPTLIVHGGWFRRALEMHSIDCAWEPVIVDAVTKDPEDNYVITGRLEQPIRASIMKDDGKGDRRLSSIEMNNRRSLLQAMPTPEEIKITEDMKQGRKPERYMASKDGEGDATRRLSVNRKKILLHGYCSSGSPFTSSHFSNAVEFSDPDTSNPQPSNWSNNQFALKIGTFAYDNNIDSCGIIAHSQGGLASLHLYNYYWSCLDYAGTGGSRLIQSVGSPYQGSPLAGFPAKLAEVFGGGCGENIDLTRSGASAWLSHIYYVSRSLVHFRTTSVKKPFWWSWNACSHMTDFLLWDPEDGAIEKHRGELPGGNNRGHNYGLCHTLSMNQPGQTANWNINNDMNNNAFY